MGGNHSKPSNNNNNSIGGSANNKTNPISGTATTINNNNNINDDDNDDQYSKCFPTCNFFFAQDISKKLRQVSGRTKISDPMGTPLPDTPLFQRKGRGQQQHQHQHQQPLNDSTGSNNSNGCYNNNNNTLFSSHYQGLEKEASTRQYLTESLRGYIYDNNIDGGENGLFDGGEGKSCDSNISSDAAATNTNTTATTTTNNDNQNNSRIPQISEDVAQIYEGPDVENYLHEKYQLMEVLGVGSTSTVHRCVCKNTGKEYACKVIDCAMIEDRFQGMMVQFQVEIEALRQLQHPGIIRLYDVYITGDKIFIVMELMEGGELFDYVVQKGTLTEEEASKIVYKVTSALVYMHSKNIVHRDLKPENLLLKKKPDHTPNNNNTTATTHGNSGSNQQHTNNDIDVKIIDFGLSKAMEGTLASTFLGTRGYLAPEMLQRRDYTRAVDSWALGVIVFVLLCGCLPFDDDSSTVPSDDLVRAKFVLRFPRWAKNLSPSAKDLLNHLLDVNPFTRYTTEQALEHPWVQGVTAKKDSLLASPGRIKKSPMISNNNNNTNNTNTKNYTNNNKKQTPGRKYIPVDANLTPPAAGIVRQASL